MAQMANVETYGVGNVLRHLKKGRETATANRNREFQADVRRAAMSDGKEKPGLMFRVQAWYNYVALQLLEMMNHYYKLMLDGYKGFVLSVRLHMVFWTANMFRPEQEHLEYEQIQKEANQEGKIEQSGHGPESGDDDNDVKRDSAISDINRDLDNDGDIPEAIVKIITTLCEESPRVEYATYVQSPRDRTKIYVIGINVKAIKKKLYIAMKAYPKFKVRIRNRISALQTRLHGLGESLIVELREKEKDAWSQMKKWARCELLVTSEEMNKENPQESGAVYAVLPAHLMMDEEENNDGASSSIDYNIMDAIRGKVESRTTISRFIAIAGLGRKLDLTHPPLLAYRHWYCEDHDYKEVSPARMASDSSNHKGKVECKSFMNDIALLGLEKGELSKIRDQVQGGAAMEMKKVLRFGREELEHHTRKRTPVLVKGARGHLIHSQMIAKRNGKEYGLHLSFTLTSRERSGEVHTLRQGDCGSIVRIEEDTNGVPQPVGMFIGTVDFRKIRAGNNQHYIDHTDYNSNTQPTVGDDVRYGDDCDDEDDEEDDDEDDDEDNDDEEKDPIYQAIILSQAFEDLVSSYPHYLKNIEPLDFFNSAEDK